MILLGCALLSVFGSNVAKFPGAGALGVLTMATVAAHRWGDAEKVETAMLIFLDALHSNCVCYILSVASKCFLFEKSIYILYMYCAIILQSQRLVCRY